jgi:ferredoxin-nitrite reductase
MQSDGRRSIGVPVHVGLLGGSRLVALGDLLEPLGAEARITRQQNLVLADVPAAEVDAVVGALRDLELPLELNGLRGNGIACTGEPHCNYSVTETKTRLDTLVAGLEERFGDAVAPLRLHLDGCPHACAQHWVGDLGFQATTGKDAEGKRISAYDIFVRGSLGPAPEVGRSLFRRVASDALEPAVEGIVRGWLAQRTDGETFTAFQRRLSDDELGVLAGLEPAKKRVREEVEA